MIFASFLIWTLERVQFFRIYYPAYLCGAIEIASIGYFLLVYQACYTWTKSVLNDGLIFTYRFHHEFTSCNIKLFRQWQPLAELQIHVIQIIITRTTLVGDIKMSKNGLHVWTILFDIMYLETYQSLCSGEINKPSIKK